MSVIKSRKQDKPQQQPNPEPFDPEKNSEELDSARAELAKRDEMIRLKLETGLDTITEWMKDVDEKSARREKELLRVAEGEFQRRLDEEKARHAEELKKADQRLARIEAEHEKKLEEFRRRLEAELRRKDEDMLKLVEEKNREKEAAVLEVYKAIETQSDIISKIMEKNEKLILEVLSEMNISIEDLRKLMEAGSG